MITETLNRLGDILERSLEEIKNEFGCRVDSLILTVVILVTSGLIGIPMYLCMIIYGLVYVKVHFKQQPQEG